VKVDIRKLPLRKREQPGEGMRRRRRRLRGRLRSRREGRQAASDADALANGSRWGKKKRLRWLLPLAVIAVLLFAATACGGDSKASASTSPPAIGAAPTATVSSDSEATVTVNQDQNGETVDLKPGDTLQVILNSTYWEISPVLAPGTLALIDGPTPEPSLPCMAGGGCGTVKATYLATGPGDVSVEASRTTCGEALLCAADQTSYVVKVHVEGP
jgi:hypothetical protein